MYPQANTKKTFSDFGIDLGGRSSGKVKTFCPHCHQNRRDQRDKSLSVDIEKGVWHCHYCSWSGTLHIGERSNANPKQQYRRPAPRPLTPLSRKVVDWFNTRGISERTLEAMKISECDRVMPQTGKTMHTVLFNYYLGEELINVKYRTGNKLFILESGAELIPYNLNGIVGQSECIITEGEMDCLSFVEIGHGNCISVPNGANSNLSWMDDFIDGWFEDKSVIYIAVDTDSKGLMLREELVRRLGSERCRIVSYGDGCKDANEHLLRYGRESLGMCLKTAQDVKVEGVFSLSDYEDELDGIYQNGLQKGFITGHENFDNLCSFETKRLAIVTGIPSSGKSEFIDEMCVRFNILYGFKVAFFSPENFPSEYHAVKLIEKIGGRRLQHSESDLECIPPGQYRILKEYYAENFFHIYPSDGCTVENILSRAKYLVRRRGIRILVVDPFNRLENEQSAHETETQYISRVLDRLTEFAQRNDVLVFLMAHPTKIKKEINGGIPTMNDINGSANFFNKADFGIIVHRERNENKDLDHTLVRVAKVKFRHLGQNGDATFKFNPINGRFIPWDSGNPHINFRDHCDDFVQRKLKGSIHQATLSTARDWLMPPEDAMPFSPPSPYDIAPF